MYCFSTFLHFILTLIRIYIPIHQSVQKNNDGSGIILWELLVRQCPYGDMSAIQCALAVLNNNSRPEIPHWYVYALLTCVCMSVYMCVSVSYALLAVLVIISTHSRVPSLL